MSIGGGTFRGCSKLKYVTLGDKVKYINSYAFAECKNLETFICLTASVPDTDADTFKDSYIGYSTLIVPEESIEDYKITAPWKEFGTIKSREETDIPTTKKCSKPSITYENGKLYFHTETEGAQIVSEIKCEDIKKSYDNEVSLTATYDITAYAIKANHENSDTATATLVWFDAHLKEISTYAKKINVISKPLLITQDAGMVAISGLQDEQKITIFDALGKHILTTKIVGPEIKLNLSSERGKLVIVNVERNSFKMIIK